MEKVLSAVKVGASRTEIREFPMPEIPDDAALMKVEVAGICGTDVKMYKQPLAGGPVIMGHENVGTIAKAGRKFSERKGIVEGDLVFLEHYVACGRCEWCHRGEYRHCEATDWRCNPNAIRYGYTSADLAPHPGRSRAARASTSRSTARPAPEPPRCCSASRRSSARRGRC